MALTIKTNNVDFNCKQCGYYVTSLRFVSGVNHRNHCPICLYSRHLDLFHAGDRLSACKGMMAPVGLTVKKSPDKYGHPYMGELMLVHQCVHCGTLSINRIAADDDPVSLLKVFECSLSENPQLLAENKLGDINFLQGEDKYLLYSRLFGHVINPISISTCA